MWADGTLDGLKQIAKEEGWHDKETADDKEADTNARNGDQDSHEGSGQIDANAGASMGSMAKELWQIP
jgi:hypothetical protein